MATLQLNGTMMVFEAAADTPPQWVPREQHGPTGSRFLFSDVAQPV